MTQVQVTLGASPCDHLNLLGPSFLGYGGLFVGLAHPDDAEELAFEGDAQLSFLWN
jgi:hypothetical protein